MLRFLEAYWDRPDRFSDDLAAFLPVKSSFHLLASPTGLGIMVWAGEEKMRYLASIFLACVLLCGPAYGGNNQVQNGPTPNWVVPSELMSVPENASGLVFVRRQDVVVHLDEQGQTQYLGYRIKILHPNALQIGNISIAWNPASGAPTVHVIKIHRGSEVIDVLKTASFEILRREDQLEAARLDGVLTAVLRVPDLRVGDELEVGITTRSSDPTLGKNDAGLLLLGPDPAPGRYRLELSWENGQKPNLKMTPDMAAIARKDERAIEFKFDNPSILIPPKDAPARYQWQRVVEYSDFSDWSAISRRFSLLFAGAAELAADSPLKREASRIAAAHESAFDRANAALKLVQQDVRYIYVGLNGGNLTPATAEETWQRRYGDCKGKTALLLALLAKMGIEAEPVLVNNSGTDDGLDERLPNPHLFDHVLVRARIDGKLYWLDGTLPPVVPPSLSPTIAYRWVLPLTKQGSSLDHLEWQPAKRPDEITTVEIDARAGFGQPAQVVSTTIVRGVEGLKQQVQLSGLTPDQLLSGLRQKIVGGTWQTVDDVKWRYDRKAEASVLTINGTWKIDWDDDGDGARSLALPGGGFTPPDRRVRATDQNQNLPYYNKPEFDCQVTTVRLPLTTNVANWSTKPGFDTHIFGKNYYRAFEIRDGSVRMIRSLRVEREEIDAATARQDNDRISRFDNSMGWIYYDPSNRQTSSHHQSSVPATYEIDWTADDVPCLSPTTVRQSAINY
jgi:transglutaminase-like putative cysteine protease